MDFIKLSIISTTLLISLLLGLEVIGPIKSAQPAKSNSDSVQSTEQLSDSPIPDRPLRSLMIGLAQDMSRISDGVWIEDFQMIEDGAQSIATHPKITQEEMASIKAALGDRFQHFAGFDKVVHGTAVQIAEAAQERNMQRILELQGKIRQGCVSCHATFRSEVRVALFRSNIDK